MADADKFAKLMKSAEAKKAAGDFEGAIKDYDEAIRLDPKNVDARCHRMMTKGHLGDHEGVMVDFKELLSLNSKKTRLSDASVLSLRGIAKLELGDHEGASTDFDKAKSLRNKK